MSEGLTLQRRGEHGIYSVHEIYYFSTSTAKLAAHLQVSEVGMFYMFEMGGAVFAEGCVVLWHQELKTVAKM